MRSTRLLVTGALSAALLVPIGAVGTMAGEPFTATLDLKAYTNVRDVALKAGKSNVPSGTQLKGWFFSETGSPTPAANAQGWKDAPTTHKLTAVDGEHTVYVWAKATGGIISTRGSDTTFLDRVAPVIDEVVTDPEQDDDPPVITNRNVTLEIEASDPGELIAGSPTGSGVGKYAVVNGTTMPAFGTDAWKNGPIPASVAHKVGKNNGIKNVSVFVRDRAGNASVATTVQFDLQIAGPTVQITSLADYTKTDKAPIQLKATPALNAQFLVKVTTVNVQPTAPAANSTNWKTAISTTPALTAGTNYIWAWAKDDNGSVSALPATDSILYDATAPTASFDITTSSPATSRTVNVSGSGTDNLGGSGVVKYAVKMGTSVPASGDFVNSMPSTFQVSVGNGSKTVSLFVKDAAGNVSAAASDTIVLNIPAPVMDEFDITPLNSKSLTVALTHEQTGTGINGYFVSQTNSQPAYNAAGWSVGGGSFTFPAGTLDGMKTLYIWAKDSNNSVSALPLSDTVRIDTTAPLATLSASGSTLTIGGSDTSGSGIAYYAVVKTAAGTIPSAPGFPNNAVWKSVANDAAGTITVADGDRVTAFTRDAAGNVSVVDQVADPHVNTLIIDIP